MIVKLIGRIRTGEKVEWEERREGERERERERERVKGERSRGTYTLYLFVLTSPLVSSSLPTVSWKTS